MASLVENEGATSGNKLEPLQFEKQDSSAKRIRDAIQAGSEDIIGELLNKHPRNIEELDSEGRTLLHIAVENNKPFIIPLLLDHGANIEGHDGDGRTVLHRAAMQGTVNVTRILLERGANVEAVSKKARNRYGLRTTALYEAVRRSDITLTQLLLDNGADADATPGATDQQQPRIPLPLRGGGRLPGILGEWANAPRALPPPRDDPFKMAACQIFDVTMMEFHLYGHENEKRYSKSASIYELLYGIGPQATRESERPKELMGRRPDFTWYHIPANNEEVEEIGTFQTPELSLASFTTVQEWSYPDTA
ncbi:unnamed protein product [Parascedosporium putredinis]|uniref:Ankyrin repeat protein n=1 Tax=Parascedosporium putredinis TaxID=1442378 RepID=A0A9P1HCG5_9PEZI|nr:unnamed protein product [Parascedosporium putredinis]CAI8004345.1 unnamed protein product [Parascedosporium putredinis]